MDMGRIDYTSNNEDLLGNRTNLADQLTISTRNRYLPQPATELSRMASPYNSKVMFGFRIILSNWLCLTSEGRLKPQEFEPPDPTRVTLLLMGHLTNNIPIRTNPSPLFKRFLKDL